MDERARIWVIVGISVVILPAVALMIVLIEGIVPWSAIALVIILALAIVVILLVARSLKEIRSGFPLQDERSIFLSMRAGNRAFYISIYLVLILAGAFAVIEERGINLSNSELLFVVVLLMGSIHIILSAYYNRKGRGSSR